MPQKSRPDPNSGNVISADEYEALALMYVEDGVSGTPADLPVVYADSTGRQVKVRAGKFANVRGYQWFSDPITDEVINNAGAGLPSNTSGQPRIDRLVLRLDRATRTVRTVSLQGTPAASPSAPALTQNLSATSGVFDFPLARWQVAPGYTTIAAGDVITEAWYPQPTGKILCTSTSRPFGAHLYNGLEIFDIDPDPGIARRWTGSTWQMTAPWRQQIITTNTVPTVTFTSIPRTLRRLRLVIGAKGSSGTTPLITLYMTVNDDAGNFYNGFRTYAIGNVTAPSTWNYTSQNVAHIGEIASSFYGGHFGQSTIDIVGWNQTTRPLTWTHQSEVYTTQASSRHEVGGGMYLTQAAYTSLKFSLSEGSFVSGCQFDLEGWE